MGTNTHSYDIHQASLTPHSVQPISRGKVNPIEFNLAEHTDPPNNRANLWEEFRYKADDFREWLATRCCACLSSIPSFALVIITAVLIMLLIATIPLAFALTYMNPQPSTAEDSLRDNGTDFPYTVDRIHSAWPNESEMIEYKDWDDLTTVRSTSLLPKNISVCSIYGFACTGKPNIVIPKNRRCDGYADCEDGSDELDCHECQTTLSCPSTDGKHSHRKLCLVGAHLCDKQKYCPNGEDETIYCQSECKEGQFKCQGEDICIPEEAVCDGEPQCPFGDDEKNCKDECKNGAKKCGKDTCLPKRQLCDGFVDCPDSSDEKDCDCSSCSGRNSALCNGVDKLCISKEKVCDGHDDCPGAEDEHGCHGVCPMPVSKSEEIDEEKNIEEEGGMPKDATVRCADGKLYYWEEACNGLKADCQHSCAKCNPAMAFQCHSDVTQQMKNLSIIGLDKTIDGDNSTSESATNLSIHQIFKECIHRTLVCDGKRDCADGSDEANCACGGPKTLECKQHFPSEASMVVRSCYLESQKCDGFSDCIGGEDERDCDACNNGAFLCQSEGRCIPTSARCDGTVDCLDQSDEQNCTCEECSRQPEQMYMCLGSNRCFPLRSVCKPYTICPNATKLDQLFCAVRGLEYF